MDIDQLIRSSRRSISLEITEQGKLVVRAPKRISQRTIEQMVSKHRDWIDRKRKEIAAKPKITPHFFQEGEVFYYLGEPHLLALATPDSLVTIGEGKIWIPRADNKQIMADKVTLWYQQRAKELLLPRLKELSAYYGLPYTTAKITSAKSRWGSCSGKNSICLSWYLVMAPSRVADSVMIHELCHTIHHDHSFAFWSLVEQIMPDYKQRRQWLKDNRYLMKLEFGESG